MVNQSTNINITMTAILDMIVNSCNIVTRSIYIILYYFEKSCVKNRPCKMCFFLFSTIKRASYAIL